MFQKGLWIKVAASGCSFVADNELCGWVQGLGQVLKGTLSLEPPFRIWGILRITRPWFVNARIDPPTTSPLPKMMSKTWASGSE